MSEFPEVISLRARAGTTAAIHLAASRCGMNGQTLMREAIRFAVEAQGVAMGQPRATPATGEQSTDRAQ